MLINKKLFAIPRTKINLSYNELIKFIIELFIPLAKEKREKLITDFEIKFSKEYNYPSGIIFPKSRMAFYFLLKNMDLRPGGEVLISAIHIADFVNIIHCAGFKPIVVDIDKKTYCIDYDDLERKINSNTVLFLITHLSGLITDMDKIINISKKTGVPFIEDCSQAFSSYYQEKRLGTFGQAAIFSLSLLKPICALFGGMVISKNSQLIQKLRAENKKLNDSSKIPLLIEAIKNLVLKITTQKHIFSFVVFPLLYLTSAPLDFFSKYQRSNKTVELRNSLPNNFFTKFTWQQAQLGLSQIKSVSQRERKKIENALSLYGYLKNDHNVKKVKISKQGINSFWSFPVNVFNLKNFKKFLAKHKIDSSAYLLSVLSDEPEFTNFNLKAPQARWLKKHTLLIPMYPQLTHQEVKHIASVINHYVF